MMRDSEKETNTVIHTHPNTHTYAKDTNTHTHAREGAAEITEIKCRDDE